jgi:hypothetical protein
MLLICAIVAVIIKATVAIIIKAIAQGEFMMEEDIME